MIGCSKETGIRCQRLAMIIASAFAACLVGTIAARAGDMQAAVEIVKKASDEEILAELQRRQEARRAAQAPTAPLKRQMITRTPDETTSNIPRGGPKPRGAQSDLASLDEGELVQAVRMNMRAIYGVDDRREWHQLSDSVRRIARASVAMFSTADMTVTSSNVKLNLSTLGEDVGLCPGEKFAEQATGAYCSGTLVREDVVLTAGHCVREISNKKQIPIITDVRFVFGYHVETPGAHGPNPLRPDQIYHGKQVLAGELFEKRDWALVQLDKPVPGSVAEPVTVWRKTPVDKGEKVFVIGYPSGLPLKYAPGAEIRDNSNPVFFVANLDTFGGNSGSGVFDETTKELIGILVRGEVDYVRDASKGCMRTNFCPTSSCRGEDVTRISLVPTP